MIVKSTDKVSIRYVSGGHSFSEAELAAINEAQGDIEVIVVTPKVTLVPCECYDEHLAHEYLLSLNMTPSPKECVVASVKDGAMVAVMAVDSSLVELLRGVRGNVTFTSPLLLGEPIERGMLLELDGEVAFIRIYNGGLLFAEAVTIDSDADLSYIVEKLNSIYGIYNMYAHVRGDVERVMRVCGGCFTNLNK